MDIGIKISRHALKNNVYAYCTNSVPTHADTEGTDAYWLTDSGNVGGAGHTSLLLEDDDGVWYYFYWGPEEYGIPAWTQAKVILKNVPVSFDNDGMLNLKALNDTLNEGEFPLYARRYDKATLFTGDYSKSVDHAESLRATYEDSLFEYFPAYNVLITNCMQASASVMQASNPIYQHPVKWSLFSLSAIDIVPTCVGNMMELFYPSNTVKDDPMGAGLAY